MANTTKPKYVRNKSIAAYEREIRDKESRLRSARKLLGNVLAEMKVIQAEYRYERKQLLRAETKRTKRPEKSGLTLAVYTEGVNEVPVAEWRKFVRFTKESQKKHGMAILTPRIKHRGAYGWSLDKLMKYGHSLELGLVEMTEIRLTKLRQGMEPYKKSVETLSKSLAKLRQGMKRHYPDHMSNASPSRQRTRKPKQVDLRQLEMPLPNDTTDDKPMRPQFKHPDGVLYR